MHWEVLEHTGDQDSATSGRDATACTSGRRESKPQVPESAWSSVHRVAVLSVAHTRERHRGPCAESSRTKKINVLWMYVFKVKNKTKEVVIMKAGIRNSFRKKDTEPIGAMLGDESRSCAHLFHFIHMSLIHYII